MNVIVQENTLGINVQLHFRHFLQLIGTGDLAMDDAVTVIFPGIFRQSPIQGAEHPVQAGVTDGMDRHLHAHGIGKADHLVKGLLGEHRQAASSGIIRIRSGQKGRSGSQSAVTQHFQRACSEQFRSHAGILSRGSKILQILHVGKIALLIHTDSQLPGLFQFPVSRHHFLPGNTRKNAVIIAMAAGNTIAVELSAGQPDHTLQLFPAGCRDGIVDCVHGIVEKDAVRLSIFHDDLAAGHLRRFAGDTQNLQGLAVDNQCMTTGTACQHGIFGRNFIQIPAVGHPVTIGKKILIPAAANDPATTGRLLFFQAVDQASKASGMGIKRRHIQGLAIVEQMHMAVIKTGADEFTLEVYPFAIKGQCIFIGAGKEEFSVLHHKGFRQRKVTGINGTTVINRSHRHPSDQNTIAMVNFMLNDLCRPAGEGFQPGLEVQILIADLDFLIAFGFSGTAQQRKTAFLRIVLAFRLDDLRIQHGHIGSFVVKYDDPLGHTDHVGCHAHTALLVGNQGIQQILGNGQIFFGGRRGSSRQENRIVHQFFYHRSSLLIFPHYTFLPASMQQKKTAS